MYCKFEQGMKYPSDVDHLIINDDAEGFKDAGYIIEDGEVVVDIDCLDKTVIRTLLDTFNIHTETVWTDRGAHLYFEKPKYLRKRDSFTPLGFKVEYKYKRRGHKDNFVCIKRNGVMRVRENPGVREQLPPILKPGNYENLLGLQEGESRNTLIYKQKKRIQTMDNWHEILSFINEYVFAEPMDSNEFETVSRDEPLSTRFDEEYALADYLMKELAAVTYLGILYIRYNGSYINDENDINRIVYDYCMGKRSSFVEEVVKQMTMRATPIPRDTEFKVKFKNGYLDNGRFIEADYTEFTPYVVNVEYDPNAEPVQIVDEYLEQLSDTDKDYRDRLIETISHCFVVNKEFKRLLARFHIIRGNGGNGKGTFLQVIKHILGVENCSALSLKQMTDERYFYNMAGKLANLGDDIDNAPIKDNQMKMLKNLSTCDPVEIRKMRANSRTEELVITLIFTSNHNLKSFEKGEAYQRRVDWLPIFSQPKVKDPTFISKLTTPKAIKYWVRLVVEGYFRLYKNKGFTESDIVRKFNKQYHEENNNTTVFVKNLTHDHVLNSRPPAIYNEYEQWCEDNGEDPLKSKTLKEAIRKEFGLIVKTVWDSNLKKTVKAFVEPNEKDKNRLVGDE